MDREVDLTKLMEKLNASPPPEIVSLRERIEAETRAAEFMEKNDPTFDFDATVRKIVEMKLQLDRLYIKWLMNEEELEG